MTKKVGSFFIITVMLLFPITLSNKSSYNLPRKISYDKKENIDRLKRIWIPAKDLRTIYLVSYDLFYYSINDSLISGYLDKKEVALIALTIAIYESSRVKKNGAYPFKSSLFIENNNAFGIKGKGAVKRTVEYINGERGFYYLSFKHYNRFEDNINDLIHLLNRKYKLTEIKEAKTIFINMKKYGYFTAPNSYTYRLIKTYKKLKKINNDEIKYRN